MRLGPVSKVRGPGHSAVWQSVPILAGLALRPMVLPLALRFSYST